AEIEKAREELAQAAAALAPLPALDAELRELERAFAEQGRRRTLEQTERTLSAELARARERRQAIETAPERERQAAVELAAARDRLVAAQGASEASRTEWVRDKQEAETKRRSLLEHLRELERHLGHVLEMGEHGPCPTCAQPV